MIEENKRRTGYHEIKGVMECMTAGMIQNVSATSAWK
jgi:hypothetical protein